MKTITTVISLSLLLTMPLAQAAGTLNIYNWSDYIAEGTVPAFERANKVKVRYDIYDSNEVLRAKLMTGKTGYDIVVPSHNTLGLGVKAGMFLPLDKSKIPNYKNLDPALLKLMTQFDPGNAYSIPYFWGINTLGINVDKVKKALGGKLPDNPWDLVFKPELAAKLKGCGMSVFDSPSEFFPAALHYYGKNPNTENLADYQAMMPALKQLRPNYSRFSSSGYINELAGGSVCVAMGFSGDLNIAKRRAAEAKNGVNIQVMLPKSGLDVWVDVMAIPKDAVNVDNAYRFINAMLEPKTAAANANAVTYAPGVPAARQYMNSAYVNDRTIFPTADDLKGSFVGKTLPAHTIQGYTRLWQSLKSGH
ncbi:polyamine ABC transporter substrate-binding protein [Craterilacuibacter sp. RT1T]|uniref:polyamine ABC transporter substrate-binding protein n=1 Tax=Craterilacuibacter sp. RT1T TaxID=2942211 RepID=UPI0020BD778F|nr:polyamine ABC transporter substrate-binding protein [Craterilacuibacter sp. RT1T]MCL6263900.1 polyamine ABC transporter substrate-binding protein [Craterilacuibacter sp. RT1T]